MDYQTKDSHSTWFQPGAELKAPFLFIFVQYFHTTHRRPTIFSLTNHDSDAIATIKYLTSYIFVKIPIFVKFLVTFFTFYKIYLDNGHVPKPVGKYF